MKLTTNTKADARTKFMLVVNSTPTGNQLAVPYSLQVSDGEFKLGTVRLKVNTLRRQVIALDAIPASWFVDISKVADESETEDDYSDLV